VLIEADVQTKPREPERLRFRRGNEDTSFGLQAWERSDKGTIYLDIHEEKPTQPK